MAMQRGHAGNVSIAEAIQAQRLRGTYTNEMAEVARTNQEFLLEELSKNFVKFRREEAFRFARTEDEKCRGLLLHLLVLVDQLVQLFLCIDFLLHAAQMPAVGFILSWRRLRSSVSTRLVIPGLLSLVVWP